MSRMKGKASTDHPRPETVVGIDVSKAYLDAYLHPFGIRFRVRDDAIGHAELQDR